MKKWACVLVFLLAASAVWETPLRAAATGLVMSNAEDADEDDGGGDSIDDDSGDDDGSAEGSGYESQLDDLNDQIEKLKNEQEDIKKQLANTANALSKKVDEQKAQEADILLVRQEIALKEERLGIFNQQIQEKLSEIDQKQEEIKEKQSEINYNFDQYKKRLRANYMAGESSKLAMIIGASDFTDFLMRGEIVEATARHDQDLVNSLHADRQDLEKQQEGLETNKKELEVQKKGVEEEKAGLEAKRQEYQTAYNQISATVHDIAAEQEYYKKNEAAIKQQMAQAQKEVERIYEALKPKMSETFVGGEWAWPLPGHTQITSSYMAKDRSNHTGTDIAGGSCYGKKIVAANDGKVIFTAATNSGYGHYVIVDHGGGYSSLYAHMSVISVSVGQAVTRGATEIGKVGSTGWATGPHLHFEVRQDGKAVNPMPFIT